MQYQTDDEFKKALAFGMEGEEVVCKALLSMGVSALPLYQFAPEISPKILTAAARFNSPDLVCFGRKGAFFVEVKTRIGERFGLPEDALNSDKIRRMTRNAQAYIAFKADPYRIDAICLVLDENGNLKRAAHYENIV